MVSEPVFLVDLPAWHTIFFCNLADLFRPGRQAPFESSSPPGSFWPDVFVTSRLPWSRFGLSVLGHVAAIAAILASAQFWPQSPAVVVRQAFNRHDVIYYAPSEYLPPLDTGGTRKPSPEKGDPAYAPQPIISVPPEADNRSQTIVTPSDIKLNHDLPLPNIVAWSQNPAQPSIPLASMAATATNFRVPTLLSPVVAPAPETIPTARQRSPSLSQAVVAPAPDLDVQSSARTLQAPQAAIVEPAPRIDSTSGRRLGDLNIGHSAVVAPAPELPVSEQYADQHAGAGRTQPAMGGAGPAVVPPPPSIAGNGSSAASGRFISLGVQPATLREAPGIPEGNRRGTFAATPAGKTGAAGTPDISASASPGSGSGSAAGKNTGAPPGLSVGAAPNTRPTSTVAGPGQGTGGGGGTGSPQSSSGAPLVADATPPRVTSTPAPSASAVSQDKITDVDHWIFGDRKFYAMTLNMPNLNSAGGSWVIRFAELNGSEKNGNEKGELSAPVATQKVDPAYPMELMRRNVHGTVTLYAVIRNDGSVTDIRVLRGVDDNLDKFARAALSRWRFRPATKNGSPVDLEAVIMIPFRPVRSKSGF